MSSPALARELPPRLELQCLRVLWQLGEGSVRQIQQSLHRDRALAYTTVMTVMDRLARRGCVERRKAGRSFVYVPVLSRDHARRMAVRDLVDCFFEGSDRELQQYLDTQ